MEPRAISHFDIVGPLASGGMGVVYRARDRVLQREVALKLVRPDRAGDAEARRRFLVEARAAATLTHPGIAAVYEAGEAVVEGLGDEPLLFIAEELVDGETLSARVRRGPLPIDEVVRLGTGLGEALGAAHDRRIVHRDVKPSNLMVTRAGALKVLDFGIAKVGGWPSEAATTEISADRTAGTTSGVFVGTPAYMAPEQAAGGQLTPAADVYASGCVLYELLAGTPPFAGADVSEVLRRSLVEAARPLTEVRPDVPPALAAVVARAMARNPAERYRDGHQLAAAVRDAASGRSEPAVSSRRTRSAWALRAAAVALGIAAVAVATWFAASRLTQPVLAFRERDFIVVADVVNATGEPVFDLALKSALETGLRQSRYVNVLDSNQVQNALRMMRVPPEARLDPEVGRSVCRRVGAAALLVPRILRAGTAYEIEAALVEPPTGRTVDAVKVTARGREEVLLSSIDKLTRQVRNRLGESLASIARADPPIAQYTTSSLEALQMLAIGQRAWAAGDFATAERSFREALQHDPRFAMARGSLGLVLIQFLNRPDEGRKMLVQALQEEAQVSEREYLHMRAVNKQFVAEDLQGALDDYRFLSELYPDLMPPYNNSGRILQRLRRFDEARTMYERAIKADPHSPIPCWNLWLLAVQPLKDPAAAERAARALVTLQPEVAAAQHALAWSFVAERRFAEAENGMRATLKLDPTNSYALPNLGHLQFRRGATGDAVETYRQVLKLVADGRLKIDAAHLELSLGLALSAAGKADEARRTLLEAAGRLRAGGRDKPLAPDVEAMAATMIAVAGRRDEARSLAEHAGLHAAGSIDVNYELARTWAVLGDRVRAIGHLQQAFAAGFADTYFILVDPPLVSVQDDATIGRLAPARAEGGT
jgi:eukaryotic-like serine/threonine-protein kinase